MTELYRARGNVWKVRAMMWLSLATVLGHDRRFGRRSGLRTQRRRGHKQRKNGGEEAHDGPP